MQPQAPNPAFQPHSIHIRNIALDIILTLLTCGLFYFYIQYVQMLAVNDMLQKQKYNYLLWFVLVLVTCGLYHMYHEYIKSVDIARCLKMTDSQTQGFLSLFLTFFGLAIITDAIQQTQINEYFKGKQS